VSLLVNDVVRTDTGLDGTIVSLTDDGLAAFVQATDNGKSVAVIRYRLGRLTMVKEAEGGAQCEVLQSRRSTMQPTVEELAYAVICLSSEDLPTDQVPQAVLDRLIELDVIHVEVDSAPVLTVYGRKTYRKMINGGDMPEFNRARRLAAPSATLSDESADDPLTKGAKCHSKSATSCEQSPGKKAR
jgi:hypothetical protein